MSSSPDSSPDNRTHEQGHIFTLLPAGTPMPAWAQVTSVAVLPFDSAGCLVLAQLANRGIDLAGGHVEPDDTEPAQTAQREADEEICVRLGPLRLAAVIQSSLLKDDAPTAMLVMTGPVEQFNELKFAAGEQSRGRVSLPPAAFLAQYRGGMGQAMMRQIVAQAVAVYQPPQGYQKPQF